MSSAQAAFTTQLPLSCKLQGRIFYLAKLLAAGPEVSFAAARARAQNGIEILNTQSHVSEFIGESDKHWPTYPLLTAPSNPVVIPPRVRPRSPESKFRR